MKFGTEKLIERPVYLQKLEALKNQNDLVKIITGVRRCGKSKIFTLFQKNLLAHDNVSDKQIVDINLENRLQTKKIGLVLNKEQCLVGFDKLLDHILAQLLPNKMNYVFIDEIQLLEDWPQVANTLRLQKNVDLYLTGSNAYMFSSDLANFFGGRYMEIKVQPYSFSEYFSAYQEYGKHYADTQKKGLHFLNPDLIYQHYITESGFPQTLLFGNNTQLIHDYLMDTVYNNTIQKDIIKRFKIADVNKLDAVIAYLFDNIGNETSIRNIENGLKAGGHNISVPTIDTYIKGLIDSYLLYKCERYDIKGKQLLDSSPKYYVADVGLRTALLGHENKDQGHILENVVYLELLRRGYRVYLGKIYVGGKMREIDFVAQKSGGQTEYYQIALYALEEEVLNRELAQLKAIDDNYPKYLLSMDAGSDEYEGIKRLNVFDWLLA